MSKIKSPQEKKALSLNRDRRNVYGENSKASRKGIPRSRRNSHKKERHAIGMILGRLKGDGDDSSAIEADALAKTTVAKSGRTRFRKMPDAPLRVVVQRKLERRKEFDEREATAKPCFQLNLHAKGIFDTHYVQALHKREIMWQLRAWFSAKGWATYNTATAGGRPGIREMTAKWREAILRDAPLLKGFFAEEPQWRDRALGWCDKILSSS